MITTFSVRGHKWCDGKSHNWVEARYVSETAAALHRAALLSEKRPGVDGQVFMDTVYESHEEYIEQTCNRSRL